jgi:integrase
MLLMEFAAPRMKQGDEPPTTREEAKVWEVRFKVWVIAGCPELGNTPKPSETTIATAMDDYTRKYAATELASGAADLSVFAHLQDIRDNPLTDLFSRSIVRALRDDLVETIKKSTVNTYLKRLRHFLNWCLVEYGLTARLPFYHKLSNPQGIKLFSASETPGRSRRISEPEEAAIRMALEMFPDGDLMRGRIDAALDGCMRVGEMLKIQRDDILWKEEKHRGKLMIRLSAGNTKGKKARLIPVLTKRFRAFLEARRFARFPFGTREGDELKGMQRQWDNLLEAAGLETWAYTKREDGEYRPEKTMDADLNWHDWRHEGATRLYLAGMWPMKIQKLLGHAKLQQTMTYLNITEDEFADAMAKAVEAMNL